MSDIILRKLRAQVTIAMDATLRRAAFEIMSIFENTLSDHKRELAEKEEVVAQLKLKLQVAELRLKDLQVEGPSIAVAKQTQAIPEIVPDVPIEAPVEKEIIPAPEIDFEVPDDWCAPLGAELVPKQEEAICPSVRLREFSIPLCHVPIIKKESEEHFVSPQDHFVKPQTTSGSRRSSRRLAAASEMPKPVQGGALRGKGSRMQNEIRLLFKQLNQEDFIDLTRPGLRKSRRLEEGEKKKKPFHCTKCSKRFRRPQTLKKHQERKHKKKGKAADAKEDLKWTQPLEDVEDTINDVTSQGQDSRQNTRPERVGKKRRRAENLRCQNLGVQTKERYVCSVCQKVKKSKFSLVEHYRVHTGEKPYSCGLCSLNFRFKSQLYYHDKMHHKSESQ